MKMRATVGWKNWRDSEETQESRDQHHVLGFSHTAFISGQPAEAFSHEVECNQCFEIPRQDH